MKKVIVFVCALVLTSVVFAASYKNNTYQKLADEWSLKAKDAFDAGQYDDAVEYSKKASENAELSKGYIDMMLARTNAEDDMKLAENKINWAKGINAENTYPMAWSSANEAYNNAKSAFEKEDWATAQNFAKQAVAALDGIHEVTPLPEFYIVRPWAQTRDCFWNISGRPYVYNNPLLWENLYQANKNDLPRPNDPNLILPGMKMKIPSLTGEYREGVYNPAKQYEAYGTK